MASTPQQQPAAPSLAMLEAVRVLAAGVRGRAPFPLTPECLAAAEELVGTAGRRRAAGADQQHGARLVLQWAVGVLVAPQGKKDEITPSSKTTPAMQEARVWRACERALTPPTPPKGAGATTTALQPSLATTLSQASALGLFQAVAATVFGKGTPAEAADAAVRAAAALTGLPYPPVESWTLTSLHTVGLPQVPADRALDLVATEVIERLHAHPDAPGGAALGALALQYLTLVQTQQANQRKAFPLLVNRLLRPLLALQRRFHEAPHNKAPGSLALRRAIDAAIGELLFHREHLDGLRAVLLSGAAVWDEGEGGGKGRKRRRKGKEAQQVAEGGSPPPQQQEGGAADKWAAYQGQLLQAMEGWINHDSSDSWAPETRALVLSLAHLYQTFVRRLGAAAALQQQAKAATAQGAGAESAPGTAAATAVSVGQKRREAETAAAAAVSSAYAARPAFAMALRLWALLWRPEVQQREDEEARVARLTAARGVLEAVLTLGVYHYDSDQSAGGQFRSVERVFLQLLDGASSSPTDANSSLRVMEGEVRCLAALLRIDHRVAARCLPRLLGLLAGRYALADADDQGLRQACLRTVGEAADTYARLRQVGALLQALLTLEGEEAARALVADAEVSAALGRAIRDCPPPQFVQLWDVLAGGSEEDEGEKEGSAATIAQIGAGGVRFRLLSLLLAHVRVSALNAAALGGRAAAVMARLEALVLARVEEGGLGGGDEGGKGRKGKKKQAPKDGEGEEAARVVGTCLELYARLLELQVTCDYWSGTTSPSSTSHLLQRLLPHRHAGLSAACKPALDHLAVARLRQLRQEKGVRGIAQADTQAEATQEVEQRELTAFLFSSPADDQPLELSMLGASLPLWAPHATQEHLDAFWNALLQGSFEAASSTSTSTGSRSIVESDAAPALRLLADAGFYEVGPLAQRCLPCALRLQLRALLPPSGSQEALDALENATAEEVGEAAAELLVPADGGGKKASGKGGEGKGKGKASSSSSPLAAAVLHVLGSSKPPVEAAVAQAVHAARLLNSLPRGYLPPAHAPLRFAAAVLLDAALAQHHKKPPPQRATALQLALTESALQALRTSEVGAAIPALVAGRPALLQWLVARALGGEGPGVDLLGAFLKRLLRAEEGATAVRALFAALEDGHGLVGRVAGEDEAEAAHALDVVAELVVPFITASTSSTGGAASLAALLSLVKDQLSPHLLQRLRPPLSPTLRPAVLRLHALLLEMLGPRAQQGGKAEAALLRQLLPGDALALALSSASASAAADTDEATMGFLAAYLRWAPSDARSLDEEGAVLEAMVGLVLRPTTTTHEAASSTIDAAASALAAALGRAAPVAQWRALAKLGGAVAQVGAALASAVGEPGTGPRVGREAAVLARACRLMALLVEQGGAGEGPGAPVVAAMAQPVLSHVVRALGALEAAVLSLGGLGLSSGERAVGRAVVEGLDLLRLYTRKRWLFFAHQSAQASPAVAVEPAEADGDEEEDDPVDGSATADDAMDVVEEEQEEEGEGDEETAAIAPASPAPSTPSKPRGPSGGMRVEDVGRFLAPVAALPAVLVASVDSPSTADGCGAGGGDGRRQTAEEAAFGAACSLLSALLKHHQRLIYQGAPPAIQAARGLFRALLHPQGRLGPVAAKAWARLMEHMAGHPAALRKHLMLLLVDYLSVSPQLAPELKACLQPAAFALIDALTPFEIQHMHAALLDSAGQALLKKLHGDYQQRYKYRGRV